MRTCLHLRPGSRWERVPPRPDAWCRAGSAPWRLAMVTTRAARVALAVVASGCSGSPRLTPTTAFSTPAPSTPEGFVLVRPGTFMMGSPKDEPGREEDEVQHPVTITRAFWLQRTEVTHQQWRVLFGGHAAGVKGCSECPVEVSWWEAVEHCNRLSGREGLERCYTLGGCSGKAGHGLTCATVSFKGLDCRGYRLPTEAEWELAARAGTTTGPVTHRGQDASKLGAVAWCGGNSRGTSHPVGRKSPNALGLHDMLGNVSEWVWDWKGAYVVEGADPEGADYDPYGAFRIYRGGSWSSDAKDCRAAARAAENPDARGTGTGLRPARTYPAETWRPTAATRAAEAETLRIDAEIRRVDAELKSSPGREIVFPGHNTLGASSTIFEHWGEVRKIVRRDFGETGQSSTAYYYRSGACIFALSANSIYKAPVNDYSNPDAGKPLTAVQRRYYLAKGKLVRYLKDKQEIRLPHPQLGEKMLREAAAALQVATRCQPRKPPCAGCSCATKDCRTISCEEK
jgi:formylglycine-generating enzyme required for sulfatase activity